MRTVTVSTWIGAPVAVCFDLARSVEAHLKSTAGSGERVVGGVSAGLLGLGDEVTWEGKHFGIKQRFTSRITRFEPPCFFQDRMIDGAFAFFEHDHFFEEKDGGTVMRDVVAFRAPYGLVGWGVERLLLARHLRRFLRDRGAALKVMAEGARR